MKKQNRRNSRKGSLKKPILSVLLIAFCAGFLFSAWHVLSIVMQNKRADAVYTNLRMEAREQRLTEDTEAASTSEDKDSGNTADSAGTAKQEPSVDIRALQRSYPELTAWLLAEGTGIDLPVMQGADNEYYLTHLCDGTENPKGSLFVDCRNTGVLTDDNTVIYGHNMKDSTMFTALLEFKSQEFYDAHPTMVITTQNGDYLIELICGTVEDGNYEFVRFDFDSLEDMSVYVSKIQGRSTFQSNVQLQPGDKLVSLCTCTYERQNARYMLVGRVVPREGQ